VKSLPVFLLLALAHLARADDPLPLRDALARPELRCTFTATARDQITLAVTNSSAKPLSIAIPAGAICSTTDNAARLVVLQSATLSIAPDASAEALLPSAALSSKATVDKQPLRLSAESEPRLDPLLKRLAGQQDVPRTTAQFAIFSLLEDMTFAQWEQFLAARRPAEATPEPHPTPAEVVQAIDVLGLLRELAPERIFALAADGELKLRALRNPWCRAKAMQLYGVTLTGDPAEAGLPNLSQLLHTKPGDNCPICRQRAEMQKGASDF
jgi:hypothetical protein